MTTDKTNSSKFGGPANEILNNPERPKSMTDIIGGKASAVIPPVKTKPDLDGAEKAPKASRRAEITIKTIPIRLTSDVHAKWVAAAKKLGDGRLESFIKASVELRIDSE